MSASRSSSAPPKPRRTTRTRRYRTGCSRCAPSPRKVSVVDLEARIAGLPCWRGDVTLEPLAGGLSNSAYVVDDGRARYVARCGSDIPAHHVYRDRERAASIAAHAAGLSPELIYFESGVMVIRYVEGRTLTEADLAVNLERIAALLKTCHRVVARHLSGPASMFWAFHVIRDYSRALRAAGAGGDLLRYESIVDALEARQAPLPIVFGHHDLLPGNFIDDGRRLWLIDWEYGGFGTAMFDLANLATNGAFSATDDIRLMETYFERPLRNDVQRSFDAMKVASALREAAWAMVSAIHLAVPGVDYRTHAALFLRRTEVALAEYVERHGPP